jgi:hypothetical protein
MDDDTDLLGQLEQLLIHLAHIEEDNKRLRFRLGHSECHLTAPNTTTDKSKQDQQILASQDEDELDALKALREL